MWRDHLLEVCLHLWWEVSEFTNSGYDHGFDLGFINYFFQVGGEVLADDYGNSTGVDELMLHLSWGVHGVCVYEDKSDS